MKLLVSLADTGSVTAAARATGVSQPAVSQNLRVIERHYGFPLLMRVGHRLVLTGPARAIVDYARRIVRLAAESERAARDLLELRAGRLAVAATATPGAYLVPALLAEFRQRHPDVELQLALGDADDVERRVLDGAADLGVVSRAPAPHTRGAALRTFRRDELALVAPSGHPLAAAPRLDAQALAAHALVVRERGAGSREALERALAAAGLPLRVAFALAGNEAVLAAAQAGLGAGVVSELAVAGAQLARGVRVRRLAGAGLAGYLGVVTHPDVGPGPAARAFIALLERGTRPASPEAA